MYWTLKPSQREWAKAWQDEWQTYLCEMETVQILGECFIAPEAKLFAEPGRPIVIGAGVTIAGDCVIPRDLLVCVIAIKRWKRSRK